MFEMIVGPHCAVKARQGKFGDAGHQFLATEGVWQHWANQPSPSTAAEARQGTRESFCTFRSFWSQRLTGWQGEHKVVCSLRSMMIKMEVIGDAWDFIGSSLTALSRGRFGFPALDLLNEDRTSLDISRTCPSGLDGLELARAFDSAGASAWWNWPWGHYWPPAAFTCSTKLATLFIVEFQACLVSPQRFKSWSSLISSCVFWWHLMSFGYIWILFWMPRLL